MVNMNMNHLFLIGCLLIKESVSMMLHGVVHLVEIFILIVDLMDVSTYQQVLQVRYTHKSMLIYQLLFIDKKREIAKQSPF